MGCCCTGGASAELYPCNPPLMFVQAQGFVREKHTSLVIKEKMLSVSGDDFDVKDTSGRMVVQCKGKTMSLRDKKTIVDPHGRPLFTLMNKRISFMRAFYAHDANGQQLMHVRKRFGKMKPQFRISMTNAATGEEKALRLKGNWRARKASIMMDGQAIAEITRDRVNMGEALANCQTYEVNVAPGVDLALIAAICICFDETEHEGARKVPGLPGIPCIS